LWEGVAAVPFDWMMFSKPLLLSWRGVGSVVSAAVRSLPVYQQRLAQRSREEERVSIGLGDTDKLADNQKACQEQYREIHLG